MVGYVEARPNFAMLNEIPLRLREHADRQQASARAGLDAVASLEAAAIDEAGGAVTRTARETAQARLAAIDAEIVELQDKRDTATKAQRDLAQGSDPAYASAIAALAETLAREDVKTLLTCGTRDRDGAGRHHRPADRRGPRAGEGRRGRYARAAGAAQDAGRPAPRA